MCHYVLVHPPISIPKMMKIPAAKAAVEKEWNKLKNLPSWSESKVRATADVIHKAHKKKTSAQFAKLME